MSGEQILPGVYQFMTEFTDELGPVFVYLLVSGDKAVMIDAGTAHLELSPIKQVLGRHGLSLKKNLVAVLCTHAHPDHVAGLTRLLRASDAKVMIHERDAPVLEDPSLMKKERLHLDFLGRLSTRFTGGPFQATHHGYKPDETLHNNDSISFGAITLQVIHTGGHSAGHCAYYDSRRRLLFSGDEVNTFQNNPRLFFTDLSGSLSNRVRALTRLENLAIDYLFPTHDVPYLFSSVKTQITQGIDATQHFLSVLLNIIGARGSADIEQIVFDLTHTQSAPTPLNTPLLLRTTVHTALLTLQQNGLIDGERGVWSMRS